MDRGIKKWAPFQALEQQGDYLAPVFKKRHLEVEHDLMDDQINKINEILTYHANEKLNVTYFDYSLKQTFGYITKIDNNNKTILINNVIIPFIKIKNITF